VLVRVFLEACRQIAGPAGVVARVLIGAVEVEQVHHAVTVSPSHANIVGQIAWHYK
jgi:hypothetical protein